MHVLGVCWGSAAGMTCRGHLSDLMKLIFGLAAELPVGKVSFKEAMLPFIYFIETNLTVSGGLVG